MAFGQSVGQPQWDVANGFPFDILTFNVDGLQAQEAAGFTPPNIVDAGAAFNFSVGFSGFGLVWPILEGANFDYDVRFFVEGLGEAADEKDLPLAAPIAGTLVAGGSPYAVISPNFAAGTLDPGIYILGVVVTFPAIGFMTGFRADTVFQVK